MYGMCVTHDGAGKGRNDDSKSKDADCKHGRCYQKNQTRYLQSGYLSLYDMSAKEMAVELMGAVMKETGITAEELAECGIMGEEANSDD